MRREKLRTLEKMYRKKKGIPPREPPKILMQFETGRWFDFDTVGRQGVEPVELDPRVRHCGGNHYWCLVGFEEQNAKLLEYVREHKLSFHDNPTSLPCTF